MFEEINLNNIKSDLKRKYDLKVEIKGNKLCCDEFNGYSKIEDICYWIQDRYDCFCDYSVLDGGYGLIIEIF